MKTVFRIYDACVKKISLLSWLPPLIARITVGTVFLESGWGKIHNIARVTEFFTSLQIPAPAFHAQFVAYSEFLFGLFILVGLLTRLATLPLTIIMIVAIYTAKIEDIQSLTDIFGFSEFLYILLLIWLLVQGPGKISLDDLLKKYWKV